MNLMLNDIKKCTKIINEYKNNIVFWLWVFSSFYILFKIWKILMLSLICVNLILMIYVLLRLYSTNNLIIKINSNSNYSIICNYWVINMLSTFKKKTINLNLIGIIISKLLFKIIFGFSFKIIITTFISYDIMYWEYTEYAMKDKNISVYPIFIKQVLYKIIIKEFIKKPLLQKIDNFAVFGYKVTVHVIIY